MADQQNYFDKNSPLYMLGKVRQNNMESELKAAEDLANLGATQRVATQPAFGNFGSVIAVSGAYLPPKIVNNRYFP